MPDDFDLDPREAADLRRVADETLVGFDPQRIAESVATSRRRERPRRLVIAAGAALVVAVGAFVGVSATEWIRRGPDVGSLTSPSPSVPATTEPTPTPTTSPSAANALSRDEAIAAARVAAPQASAYPEVIRAEAGPFEDMGVASLEYELRPEADRWVWVIILCEGCGPLSGEGTVVVLDYLDGRVYAVQDFIG